MLLRSLNSDKLEEVILAILADFEGEKDETIIETIFEKLKTLQAQNSLQKKTVIQLEVLSNLRDLQTKIIEQLHTMSFKYNIETDLRYK